MPYDEPVRGGGTQMPGPDLPALSELFSIDAYSHH
jgi:hypothetical protein